MTNHTIRTHTDEDGHCAECSCGWRCGPYIQSVRDEAVDSHRRWAPHHPTRTTTTRAQYDPVTRRIVPVDDDDSTA